jgi:hypothetical protein
MKKLVLTTLCLLLGVMSTWADGDYGTHYKYNAGPDQHLIFVSLVDAQGAELSAADLADGSYYLGAFIGNECRGEAEVELYDNNNLPFGNLFTMVVQGDGTKDNGEKITFRLYKQSMASGGEAEYIIPETTAYVPFQKDKTTGSPSAPYEVKFVPATSIGLPTSITVHLGDTHNMIDEITVYPEGSLLPYPLEWSDTQGAIAIGENVLDALKVHLGGIPVQLTAGTYEYALPMVNTTIYVDNPATSFEWIYKDVVKDANDASKGAITLPKNWLFTERLDTIINHRGEGFELKGKGPQEPSTTTYTWKSSNEDILGPSPMSSMLFEAKAAGTVVLTGTPQDGSTATSPQLTVTLVQPVEVFAFDSDNKKDTILVLQVGENLTQRLKTIVNVMPSEATNKEWSIKEDFDTEYLEKQGNDVIAKKASWSGEMQPIFLDESNIPFTIYAKDGYGCEKKIGVVIIPVQPTALASKKSTINLKQPQGGVEDISKQIYDNLKLTPDETNIDWWIKMIKLESSDPSIIEIVENNTNATSNPTNDPNPDASPGAYDVKLNVKSGTVTITAQIEKGVWDDKNIERNTDVNDPTRDVINIGTKSLGPVSFTVDVAEGFTGFRIESDVIDEDTAYMAAGGTIEVTLVPLPEGIGQDSFDATKIDVKVDPSVPMPGGWTFAEVAPTEGDNTGLKWNITTKSVGNATISVYYEKKPKAKEATLWSLQSMDLNSGWQWISLYQGQIFGKVMMEYLFGDKLGEIRSCNSILFNDTEYGYFGALTELDTLKAYKLKMKEDALPVLIPDTSDVSSYFVNNNIDNAPLSVAVRKGWNWVGNPYQYYQNLSDIFGNTQFSEGDEIRGKTAYAQYIENKWQGALTHLTPGEGYMVYKANGGQIDFVREFTLKQQAEAPAGARSYSNAPALKIDHSRFMDNMSMIAYIDGLADASHLTLYAFRGGECRGRGVAVGDRQFITIHGETGERFTFAAYDELSGQFYELTGSRAFTTSSGTFKAPVPLYINQTTTVEAIMNKAALSDEVYDLQGRRVDDAQMKKGIYVQRGKKVVK